MARPISDGDWIAALDAAKKWIETCLIGDGSVLSADQLWTAELIKEVHDAFVGHPDSGTDDFMTKLRGQLKFASPSGRKLMAEMVWAYFLFPRNVGPQSKREMVSVIWALSGDPLPGGLPALADQALGGIGNAGTAYSTKRYLELEFLIALASDLKGRPVDERRAILDDYDKFTTWIATVPMNGQRQFRHMLRYLCFPDRVEPMCSTGMMRQVLEGFQVESRKALSKWSDAKLDAGLLDLRRRLEKDYPGQELSFYRSPLVERWRPTEPEDTDGEEEALSPGGSVAAEPSGKGGSASATSALGPINLILYGPPGTGKTYRLRELQKRYTDAPSAVDEETWLQGLVANYGWRSVIAASIADLARPVRVPDLRDHRWIVAKARQRGRKPGSVQATLWGYLQEHTPEGVATVQLAKRRPPYIFSKSKAGEWHLLEDWREQDAESLELLTLLKQGAGGASEEVRRYRTVTFHPSFTYEDFVRGIRPVQVEEDGSTQFQVVDGVFKRICDEARANPAKRYALFIDEINRANIAKVFGELISLIEVDKRATFDSEGRVLDGLTISLAGSEVGEVADPPFGVPANLDVYGTMNTADRSIALLDIALRRRFQFKEMEPDYSLLGQSVSGVDVGRLLARINDRLEYLLDRDHRIGHAYLMRASSLEALRNAFKTQIIPLLQEYFFDDLGRVAQVLSSGSRVGSFVKREKLTFEGLFSGNRPAGAPVERFKYTVTPETTWTQEMFLGIYQQTSEGEEPAES